MTNQNHFPSCLTCHSIILKYIKNISNKLAINGKLEQSNIVEAVNLSSYTQSNKYTLPSDGYIQARANSNIPTIMVAIEGKNNDSPTFYLSADWQTDRFATNSIYVKKGMHVYMISQNGGASFYPIS